MDPQIPDPKAALRRAIRDRLKSATPQWRAHASAAVCSRFPAGELWRKAGSILLYAPMPEELDIWPLASAALVEEKILAFPRFEAGRGHYAACRVEDLSVEMRVGQFGIREPAAQCKVMPLQELDLVLVPGLAFDVKGNRLGRGMGFYDRLLAEFRGATCGVCFDEQIVEAIPVDAHDVPVRCVVTPTRLIGTA